MRDRLEPAPILPGYLAASRPKSRSGTLYLNGRRGTGLKGEAAGAGVITAGDTECTRDGGPAMIGATRGGGGGKSRFGSQHGGITMTGGGHTSIGQYDDPLA